MALKTCIQCEVNISEKAITCPKCGCTEPFKIKQIICDECGSALNINHKGSCPVCGNPELLSKDVSSNKENYQDQINQIICDECGSSLDVKHKGYCPICGNPDLLSKTKPAENSDKKSLQDKDKITIANFAYTSIVKYDRVMHLLLLINFIISFIASMCFISLKNSLFIGIIVFLSSVGLLFFISSLLDFFWRLSILTNINKLSDKDKGELKKLLDSYAWENADRKAKIIIS